MFQPDRVTRPLVSIIDNKWRNEPRIKHSQQDKWKSYKDWCNFTHDIRYAGERFRVWMTFVDHRDNLILGTAKRIHDSKEKHVLQ